VRRTERGSALLAVVGILLALFSVLAFLAEGVIAEGRRVRREEARSQAFFLAESALVLAFHEIEEAAAPPEIVELEGGLPSGPFRARAERIPVPGKARPRYLVTARGGDPDEPAVLSVLGVLGPQGFVTERFRYGSPPDAWRHAPAAETP